MAKAKNYNNYAEVVGNVANVYQNPGEKAGDMRFTLANHRSYTKKDGTKAEVTQFLNVKVAPGRRYAKQELITKGAFIRVVGHLENNSYQDAEGNWKGGMEIGADKIVLSSCSRNARTARSRTPRPARSKPSIPKAARSRTPHETPGPCQLTRPLISQTSNFNHHVPNARTAGPTQPFCVQRQGNPSHGNP